MCICIHILLYIHLLHMHTHDIFLYTVCYIICMVWYLVVVRCFRPLQWCSDPMRTLLCSPSSRGCSGFNTYAVVVAKTCKPRQTAPLSCCFSSASHIDHHRFLDLARNELDLAVFDCSKPIGPEVQSYFWGLPCQVVANTSRDPCVSVTRVIYCVPEIKSAMSNIIQWM